MTNERIKSLEEKMDVLLDIVPQALIAARESTTPSFSRIMLENNRKLDELISKIDDHGRRLDAHIEQTGPVVSALEVAGKFRQGTIWLASLILALTPIIGAVYAFKEWVRK